MKFVSHSPAMRVGVLPKKSHFTNYGDEIVDQEGYNAQFHPRFLDEEAVHFAEKVFLNEFGQIHGQTVLADEVTPTPFIERLSAFDTDVVAIEEQWDARTVTDVYGKQHDFKQFVENYLSEHGVNHPDYREVIGLPAQPPWPNYLEYRGTLEQLVSRLVEDGHDLLEVIRYEEQTGHRQPVIEALREVLYEQQAEIDGAVQVLA